MTIRRIIRIETLPYRERSGGKFADLRDVEIRLPRRRFARVSFNGQYRSPKSRKQETRAWNPGFAFGTEHVFIEWVHYYRGPRHLSFNAFRRGITFSFGQRSI